MDVTSRNHLLQNCLGALFPKQFQGPWTVFALVRLSSIAFCCHEDYTTRGRKGLFDLHIQSIYHKIESGQKQEVAGRNRSRWRQNAADWLSLHDSRNCFLNKTQGHLPRAGNTHSGLSLLTLIINQENAPIGLPTGQSGGGTFSPEVPSFQITLPSLCGAESTLASTKMLLVSTGKPCALWSWRIPEHLVW